MRKVHFIMAAFVLLMAVPSKAEWQPQSPKFDGINSQAIRSMYGQDPFMIMERREENKLPMVLTGIIIEAKPKEVWDVLIDYEKRPEIIYGVAKVEDVKWEGQKATFVQRNFVKFSFIKFGWKEHRIHEHFPMKKIIFYDVDSPTEPAGAYELIPLDDGNATLLLYSVIADLRNMGFPIGAMAREIPIVEEIMMTSAGIMVVASTKKYVEDRK